MLNENLNHLLFTMLEATEKVKEEWENYTFELEKKDMGQNISPTQEELELAEILFSLRVLIRDSRENIRDKCVEYLNAKEELSKN